MADFEVIIVGSGFGGSVCALRLAEEGVNVCVLERGKAYPPGSFARSPIEMASNVWDPKNKLVGLFEMLAFDGIDAVVSSGLGGGSLIYANVLIRKPENWFTYTLNGEQKHWPIERVELDGWYDKVEAQLCPVPFPDSGDAYTSVRKGKALTEACSKIGMTEEKLDLAISFAAKKSGAPEVGRELEDWENLHNANRFTCRLCGECIIGCNFGSKNTLDLNYLSQAQKKGAKIMKQCEVVSIVEKSGNVFGVNVIQRTISNTGKITEKKRELTAKKVILSAGTFGTTQLLLRSHLANVSNLLGSHFSGNGDFLSISKHCKTSKRRDAPGRLIEASHGPTITTGFFSEASERFFLEDFGWPSSLDWIIETFDIMRDQIESVEVGRPSRWTRFMAYNQVPQDPSVYDPNLGREFQRLLGSAATSACSLPIVGMGIDSPSGRMSLTADGKLKLDWRADPGSSSYFGALTSKMREAAGVLNAEYMDYSDWIFRRPITVHPLGGCPIGNNASDGVVDSYGKVFGYDNLFVIDGSMIPGPIGPNPSMTIAALAERAVAEIIKTG